MRNTSGSDTSVIRIPSAELVPYPPPVYTCFQIQKASVFVP